MWTGSSTVNELCRQKGNYPWKWGMFFFAWEVSVLGNNLHHSIYMMECPKQQGLSPGSSQFDFTVWYHVVGGQIMLTALMWSYRLPG